jgi:hypothetical protein
MSSTRRRFVWPCAGAAAILGAACGGAQGGSYAGTSSDASFDSNGSGRGDASVEAADSPPVHGRWVPLTTLRMPRGGLAAVTGLDGRIFAMGGTDYSPSVPSLASVLAYSPDGAATWSATASMNVARVGLGAATALDGRIYVVGGASLAPGEFFTPSTGAWTAFPAPPTPRSNFAVSGGADGRIYVIGGCSPTDCGALAEAYTPSTNTWTSIASMQTLRESPAAATGNDGRIYVMGGSYSMSQGPGVLASMEAYDPTTSTWAPRASMHTARFHHAAVRAANGRIYAIGGVDQSLSPLSTVEEYDPSTDTWQTVASLTAPRVSLAAAGTRDGRIFAIGGTHDGSVAVAETVEAYLP